MCSVSSLVVALNSSLSRKFICSENFAHNRSRCPWLKCSTQLYFTTKCDSKKQNRNLTKQNKNNYSNSLSLQFVLCIFATQGGGGKCPLTGAGTCTAAAAAATGGDGRRGLLLSRSVMMRRAPWCVMSHRHDVTRLIPDVTLSLSLSLISSGW